MSPAFAGGFLTTVPPGKLTNPGLILCKVQAGERLGCVGYGRRRRGKAVKTVKRSRVWIYFVSHGSPPDASGGEPVTG